MTKWTDGRTNNCRCMWRDHSSFTWSNCCWMPKECVEQLHKKCLSIISMNTFFGHVREQTPVTRQSKHRFLLESLNGGKNKPPNSFTFLSSLSTPVACSVFCSWRRLWISRIHATRLTYGLWLVFRSIPGSLSDLSIREVNKKSLPPLLSPSPGLSCLWRLLLDNLLSKSTLLCLVNLEPITPESMWRRRWWEGIHDVQPKHYTELTQQMDRK